MRAHAPQVPPTPARRRVLAMLAALPLGAGLAGCGVLVARPQRPTLFDLGTLPLAPADTGGPRTPIVLPDIEAAGALDSTTILYRLGYADDQQLRAYAESRWIAPPPQLVRQRLLQHIGRSRPVLSLDESAALRREGSQVLYMLRLELEDFVHVFEAPERSRGVLRLRATLLANTASGDRLLGQRSLEAEGRAPSADAPGGVRALTAATDAAAADLVRWLQQFGEGR